MKNRIGVMGGTFDPIHYGHLVLAEQVRSELSLDRIIFVPAGIPPHKKELSISNNIHRHFMTVLATIDNPNFIVSDIEVHAQKVSYTIDTLHRLKELYGNDHSIFFITGADAILDIESWKDSKTLLKTFKFIAGTRPGHQNDDLERKISLLKKQYDADIHLLEVPALAISSTDIRNRVGMGKSIKYLIPEAVEQYIYKNRLYERGVSGE